MDGFNLEAERRKQQRLAKLGTNAPRCGTCGETDWRCMEEHHIAGRRFDAETVILCWNCHRKVSDDQKGHPRGEPDATALLERAGHFMLGLADMLQIIIAKLYEYGLALINLSERGSDTPQGVQS